jgi:hypothetical protein
VFFLRLQCTGNQERTHASITLAIAFGAFNFTNA